MDMFGTPYIIFSVKEMPPRNQNWRVRTFFRQFTRRAINKGANFSLSHPVWYISTTYLWEVDKPKQNCHMWHDHFEFLERKSMSTTIQYFISIFIFIIFIYFLSVRILAKIVINQPLTSGANGYFFFFKFLWLNI